ncbi:hypothetical protein ACMHYJ_14305 [Castellaniella hirudinis]|uniref:hypothetical protein n=1 Tax=Castellaniella hirudinis TaxID=1144617 RepID=UPI0039C308FE
MEKNQLPCWVVLSIIAGLVLLGVFIWQFPTNTTEWASWVQAFGSIGAIIGAIWISTIQSRAEADRRQEVLDERKANAVLHGAYAKAIMLDVTTQMWDLQIKKSPNENLSPAEWREKADVVVLLINSLESIRMDDIRLINAEAADLALKALVSARNLKIYSENIRTIKAISAFNQDLKCAEKRLRGSIKKMGDASEFIMRSS